MKENMNVAFLIYIIDNTHYYHYQFSLSVLEMISWWNFWKWFFKTFSSTTRKPRTAKICCIHLRKQLGNFLRFMANIFLKIMENLHIIFADFEHWKKNMVLWKSGKFIWLRKDEKTENIILEVFILRFRSLIFIILLLAHWLIIFFFPLSFAYYFFYFFPFSICYFSFSLMLSSNRFHHHSMFQC